MTRETNREGSAEFEAEMRERMSALEREVEMLMRMSGQLTEFTARVKLMIDNARERERAREEKLADIAAGTSRIENLLRGRAEYVLDDRGPRGGAVAKD